MDKAKTIYLVKNTNKCVAVSGSNIELWWHYDGNTGQQWTYDGLYLKRNYKEGDSDQCLKLDRGDTHKGTNIMLSTCVGGKAQRWLYDKNAQAIRYADNWNKCLDLDHGNTNDGTNIWIYDCNGSDAQKWIME